MCRWVVRVFLIALAFTLVGNTANAARVVQLRESRIGPFAFSPKDLKFREHFQEHPSSPWFSFRFKRKPIAAPDRMPLLRPSPEVDFKIQIMRIPRDIDYKILRMRPWMERNPDRPSQRDIWR